MPLNKEIKPKPTISIGLLIYLVQVYIAFDESQSEKFDKMSLSFSCFYDFWRWCANPFVWKWLIKISFRIIFYLFQFFISQFNSILVKSNIKKGYLYFVIYFLFRFYSFILSYTKSYFVGQVVFEVWFGFFV